MTEKLKSLSRPLGRLSSRRSDIFNMRPTSVLASCSSGLLLISKDLAVQTYAFTPGLLTTRLQSTRRSIINLNDSRDDKYSPPDFTVIDDDEPDGGDYSQFVAKDDDVSEVFVNDEIKDTKEEKTKKDSKKAPKMEGTSWMQKNAVFVNEDHEETDEENAPPSKRNRTFRQDFRGTRVFVKGIPAHATWQDLKDHFGSIDGQEVVFASVSVDPVTGESKGVGIVQFETSEMAENAIRVMRKYPLDGSPLYVREDVQERDGAQLKNRIPRDQKQVPPSNWVCADDENASVLTDQEMEVILSLIKDRDAARRRRNYDVSDQVRDELKMKFGVHVDDRLKQWWVSYDGSHVPNSIKAVKGEGRWGGNKAWRQIPTTPENDACVNADLVNGLLAQRDIARKEKDFSTADALLEEARTAPDGELYLRIHDESRTWRIWTDAPPPRRTRHSETHKSAAEQCIDLVREKAPHKEEEIRTLLAKFPGREYPILKKLKKSLSDL